jgi:hypothetical protein
VSKKGVSPSASKERGSGGEVAYQPLTGLEKGTTLVLIQKQGEMKEEVKS